MMESILKNLEHEVTCTIFQEAFSTPKTLPCLHTFCCECLNKHLRSRRRESLPINCPICNVEIQAPNKDNFDYLPTSFYHNRLLETLSIKQFDADSDMTCGNCKKLTRESSYCFECAKFLCTDCLNARNLLGYIHENHRLIEVRKFCPQDFKALLQREPFCQQQYHEREALRYHCTQCQNCICQVCLLVEHRNHEVEHLEKAAEDQKQVINYFLERADEKVNECEKIVKNTKRISGKLEKNVSSPRRKLHETFDKLKRNMEEMEHETAAELVNIQYKRRERLKETREIANTRLKILNETIAYAKTTRDEGTSAEILLMKDALQCCFQDLLQNERDENKVREGESFVKFCANKNVNIPKLGHLQTSNSTVAFSVEHCATKCLSEYGVETGC